MTKNPYQFVIYPHAEPSIIWKESWDEAVADVSKTCRTDQWFYLCELLTGRNGILILKSDGTAVLR